MFLKKLPPRRQTPLVERPLDFYLANTGTRPPLVIYKSRISLFFIAVISYKKKKKKKRDFKVPTVVWKAGNPFTYLAADRPAVFFKRGAKKVLSASRIRHESHLHSESMSQEWRPPFALLPANPSKKGVFFSSSFLLSLCILSLLFIEFQKIKINKNKQK